MLRILPGREPHFGLRVMEELPERIGRYQVEGIIGKGAMGIVYKALDPNIDRTVAIKTILAKEIQDSPDADELIGRFKREVQTAGVLAHANIVTIYDGGEDGGMHWIAMEYVDGPSLSKIIKDKVILPLQDVLSIFVKICGAIDFAHKHGIIHRDLKPANILLTNDWDPKLADFGIARVASSTMTRTGMILGTPSYMSPEQITGQKIDSRSDIFSLGIILYELLTGERPFLGDNPTTIMYKIVHSEPLAPETINLTLPKGLSKIVMKALVKSPEDRYQKAGDMASDLVRLIRTSPELSVSTSRLDMPTAALDSAKVSSAFDHYESVEAPAAGKRRRSLGLTIILLFIAVAVIAGVVFISSQGSTFFDSILGGGSGQSGGGASPSPVGPAGPAAQVTKQISIASEPSEAQIYIDGELSEQVTPAQLELQRAAGSAVQIRLVKDCSEATATLRFDDDRPMERSFALEPMRRQIRISSDPEGARIRLNGQDKGTTPGIVEFECGEDFQLVLSAAGRRDHSETLTWADVEAREEYAVTLEALEPGILEVEAPYRATILDSRGRQLAAPERFRDAGNGRFSLQLSLSPGRYTVRAVNRRLFLNQTFQATVTEGQRRSLTLPPLGSLTVLALPANCTVTINGVDVTQFMPIRSQAFVAGRYTVVFKWGEEEITREVQLAGGAEERVTGRLR